MVGLWHWVYQITSWLLLGFVSPSSKPYCDCFASNPISGPANSVTLFRLLILLRVPANFGVMGYDPYPFAKESGHFPYLRSTDDVFSHHAAASLNGWRNSPKARSPSNPVAHLQVGAVKQPASLPLKTPENDWSKIFTTASENSAYCFMKIDHLQFQWKSPSPGYIIFHHSFQHLCFFHLFQSFRSDFCWQPKARGPAHVVRWFYLNEWCVFLWQTLQLPEGFAHGFSSLKRSKNAILQAITIYNPPPKLVHFRVTFWWSVICGLRCSIARNCQKFKE